MVFLIVYTCDLVALANNSREFGVARKSTVMYSEHFQVEERSDILSDLAIVFKLVIKLT